MTAELIERLRKPYTMSMYDLYADMRNAMDEAAAALEQQARELAELRALPEPAVTRAWAVFGPDGEFQIAASGTESELWEELGAFDQEEIDAYNDEGYTCRPISIREG